jgi:hypothetical protein
MSRASFFRLLSFGWFTPDTEAWRSHSTRCDSKDGYPQASIAAVRSLHESIYNMDCRAPCIQQVLIHEQSEVIKSLDDAAGHKDSIYCEARRLKKSTDGCTPVVAMTE